MATLVVASGVTAQVGGTALRLERVDCNDGPFVGVPHFDAPTYSTGAVTISAWVKPSDVNAVCTGTVISWSQAGNPYQELRIQADGTVNFHERDSQPAAFSNPIPSCAWSHVAITWQGGTLKYFINGALDTTTTFSLAYWGPTAFNVFSLGATRRFGVDSVPFDGMLQEVMVWDVALADGDIAGLMGGVDNTHPQYANLVAYWRMDEGVGQDVFDYTTNHDGTLGADGNPDVDDPVWASAGDPVCPTSGDLTLELADCPDDAFPGEPGYQVAVEVWMRNLTTEATGFQAFIEHDETILAYRGDLSSYTNDPFPLHIQAIATADVAAGEIRIDGSDDLGDPGLTDDSLLATLVFDVLSECVDRSVDFDLTQFFDSELSFFGVPLDTGLVNTGDVTLDDTPPVITCPADIIQAADADVGDGCTSAIVTFSVTADDACDGAITPVVDFPSGTAFPVGTTTVTATATDSCGNESTCMFDVTVTATNVITVDIQLVGVTNATTRCIHFVTDDCGTTADISLPFDSTGLFSGDIELPCGNWTMICAKDMQHTLWDSTTLTLAGPSYVADSAVELLAGDTDGDGDVDINDVTWVVATLGDAYQDGGCPWDGTRDGDFSNNGTVFTEDYSLMTPQWLMSTSCSCSGAGPAPAVSIKTSDLAPWIGNRVDLDANGTVDWRDIRMFEKRRNLGHGLSNAIKRSDDQKKRRK